MSNITQNYEQILTRLSAKFSADEVRSFPMQTTKQADSDGKWWGKAAFYIDARSVQQRLDDTCIWEDVYEKDPRWEPGILDEKGELRSPSILNGLRILIERPDGSLEWITRWDGADSSDIEGTKGGLSSASRRSSVKYGVGRYLYEVESKWEEMKAPKGRAKRPAYFIQTPRIAAKWLPDGEAPRARVTKTAAPKAAPASTEAPKDEPTGIKLSAAQVERFSNAAKGKDRNAVKPIYGAVISGDLKLAEGIKKVKALPKKSNDK